ncbi:hypothetical protein IM660_08890 [Ruania alkalisoli]|uniref:Uncharacterized protein n=1 Tax=Ruania alkalisoli TaxID=2779775 RepID=A0A7M1SXT0_9MICO|nr:HGxxPAAW family protein [Ruania alkalisoli]QOR72321.1 hypothetical protein IM660_08890 [Ruania alkalisoli]
MTTSARSGAAQSVAVTGSAEQIRPPASPPQNHGRTVAAWVFFLAGVVATTVAGVGFVLPSMPLIAVGAGLFVLGGIVSLSLRAAGLGQVRRSRR